MRTVNFSKNKVLLFLSVVLCTAFVFVLVILKIDSFKANIPTTTDKIATLGTTSRLLKYYGVDRVESMDDTNYKKLSEHSVKTVIQYLSISSPTDWRNLITLSERYNFDIVIFPSQGNDVDHCGWETPFNSPINGNYIGRVTPMLDFFNNVNNWPGGRIRVVGMVTAHEPMWNQDKDAEGNYYCHTQIADLAAIKSQLKAYVNRPEFKVWSYIDNVGDIKEIYDYSGPADYEKIMDVAATWQHCFAVDPNNSPEGSCDWALTRINSDRALLNSAGLDGKVDLVFLFQTFAYTDYGYRMPRYDEVMAQSQRFLDTGALDGFIYYTWGACWYTTDLGCPSATYPKNSNLWPIMNYISDKYIFGSTAPAPTSYTPTAVPTRLPTPTRSAPTPTRVPTLRPTSTPTRIPTRTPTPTRVPTIRPTSTTIPLNTPTRIPTIAPTPSVNPSILTFITPVDGLMIKVGTPLTFEVVKTSSIPIRKVDFYVSFVKVCTDKVAPYQCYYEFPFNFPFKYKVSAKATGMTGKTYSISSWVTTY